MTVPTDDDEFKCVRKLLSSGDHFEAVTAGHANIRYQQIWVVLPYHFQRFFSIVSNCNDFHIEGTPIDQIADQLANFDFVVRDDYLYHLTTPFPLCQLVATNVSGQSPPHGENSSYFTEFCSNKHRKNIQKFIHSTKTFDFY